MIDLAYVGALEKTTHHFCRHVHKNVWEIAYYTKGQGIIYIDDVEHSFFADQLVLLPPDTPHFEESKSGYQNIFFAVPSLPGELSNSKIISDSSDGELASLFHMLLNEYRSMRPNREGILSGIIKLIYQHLISAQCPDVTLSEVRKICSILTANISNSAFSVSELLASFSLSGDYLRRLFKCKTGKSPHEYLLDLRLDHACEMLLALHDSNYFVKEIAYDCGFDDPLYFSRIFHKKKGCSPSQWKLQQYPQSIEFVD